MVKYNLFLWYHDIPALREEVFSDPQVILRIITDLVQCKLELAGDDVPQLLSGKGVKMIGVSNSEIMQLSAMIFSHSNILNNILLMVFLQLSISQT